LQWLDVYGGKSSAIRQLWTLSVIGYGERKKPQCLQGNHVEPHLLRHPRQQTPRFACRLTEPSSADKAALVELANYARSTEK